MSAVTFAKRTARVTSAPDAAADATQGLRGPVVAVMAAARPRAAASRSPRQRLPQEVGAALAEKPMRRLETDDMLLYYPEGRRDRGVAVPDARRGMRAAPAPRRARPQRRRRPEDRHDPPRAGVQQRVRVARASPATQRWRSSRPTTRSTCFRWSSGLPPDPAVIGCHEITHYVQSSRSPGFAWFWNLFGQVYTPQIGLDSWFAEGLAVYYETKLQPGTGRLDVAVLARRLRRRLRGQALQRRRSQRLPSRIPRRHALPERAASSCASSPIATARTSCGS